MTPDKWQAICILEIGRRSRQMRVLVLVSVFGFEGGLLSPLSPSLSLSHIGQSASKTNRAFGWSQMGVQLMTLTDSQWAMYVMQGVASGEHAFCVMNYNWNKIEMPWVMMMIMCVV